MPDGITSDRLWTLISTPPVGAAEAQVTVANARTRLQTRQTALQALDDAGTIIAADAMELRALNILLRGNRLEILDDKDDAAGPNRDGFIRRAGIDAAAMGGDNAVLEFGAELNMAGITPRPLAAPPPGPGGAVVPLPAGGYTQPITGVVAPVAPVLATGDAFLDEVFGAGVASISLAQAQTRAADGTLSALARHTLRGLIRN